MREGWQIRKLGDVCFVRRDSSIHTGMNYVGLEHISSGNGVLVSLADTSGVIGTTNLFNAGDVLYGKLRPYLKKVIVADCDGCCSTELLPIRCNGDILPDFLKYWFLEDGITDKINATCGGCRMPRANMKDVFQFAFAFPSLPEQQRIVGILDREFAKIDALKANAEKSLQAAKDLFQATLKKELEPKEGWETKHLNEWATYSIGLTYKPADISKEGTIVLRSSNIQNDELVFDDIVRVACKVKDELFVENGDILMCSRNGSARLVGKVARIGKEQERMTYGTFMTIIRSKYNPILFYYFKSNDFRSQISKGENTMINQITKYMLNDVVISLPNDPGEVSRIARSLDNLNDRCKSLQENYQKTLTLCDDLKQSLLRKAFNGEL